MSQEEFNNEVKLRLAVQDEKFNSTMARLDSFAQEMKDFKDEMKDFKDEMRDRDNRRAAENAEIRQSIKEIYQTTDNKISEIRNLSYLSLTAIAAMVITVLFNLPKG